MKIFKKKHLIINSKNYNFIKKGVQGFFLIYFKKNGYINKKEFNALIFFIKKRLKTLSKIFLRIYNSLMKTEKSIGVRMGKGKGSVSDYYIPVFKGQIFLEFFFLYNNFLLKDTKFFHNIKLIFIKFSKKVGLNLGIMKNYF